MTLYESGGALPAEPVVSVVIISRNEGPELQRTIRNLIETAPREQLELIVVDDGSTDNSLDFLSDPEDEPAAGVRILRTQRLGVAGARNFGASHATGDVILFSDAHVRAPRDWHIPLCDALRVPTTGCAAPGVYSMTDPKSRGFGLNIEGPNLRSAWLHKSGCEPYSVPVLPGCFLAMRRDTFLETGGYDSGMKQLGGNDAELSCRLWLSGYEQKVVPELEISHLFRRDAPYPAEWKSMVHNRLRTALVHFQQERVARVVEALRVYEAFPAAFAMMLDTDVQERRSWMSKRRKFSDDWFFERFTLAC